MANLDEDEQACLDRWKGFVELDPKEGLREAGLTEENVDAILNLANVEHYESYRDVGKVSNIKDGMAMCLAVLGRGVSPCKIIDVRLGNWGNCLNSSEAIALCANLSSNPNIEVLEFGFESDTEERFNTEKMCALLSNALITNYTLTSLDMSLTSLDMSVEDCNSEAVRLLLLGLRESSSWQTVTSKHKEGLAIEVGKDPRNDAAIVKLKRDIAIEAEKFQIGGLQVNMTLMHLFLETFHLSDEGIGYVAAFLRTNSTLKTLGIDGAGFGIHGARSLADALKHNTTLEEFVFGNKNLEYGATECLLEAFSRNDSDGLCNTAVKRLVVSGLTSHLPGCPAVPRLLPLARVIKTNKTLLSLDILDAEFPKEDWTRQIFPELSRNETLQNLSLYESTGLEGEDIESALFDLIENSNTGLKAINLHHTGLSDFQGRLGEALRRKREYLDKLRSQPMVTPTSGRIVLCGFEFAGKTTIRNTIERIHNKVEAVERDIREDTTSCCPLVNMAWEKLTRMLPGLQQAHAETESPPRTRGFDILILNEPTPRKSVWDFAGQKEYYALHDYLFPDVKNSCFLYVCGCTCKQGKLIQEKKMKEDFSFWLRFIASNSKSRHGQDNRGGQLPCVQFVLTKRDTVDEEQLDLSCQWATAVVDDLEETFGHVIQLSKPVEVINAREDGDVENLFGRTSGKLTEILKVQKEYAVCEAVRNALDEWCTNNLSNPIMSLDDFNVICDEHLKPVTGVPKNKAKEHEDNQMAVLAYLNDMGDIIYPKGLDFVVVNPRWFGIGILGFLIDPVGRAFGGKLHKLHHDNGLVNRTNLKHWLEHSLHETKVQQNNVSVEMLIKLMTKLEICVEVNQGDSRLFLPAVFDDAEDTAAKGLRKLEKWTEPGTVYLGRRLECDDKYTTILTPGFFPRLQVRLVNHIRKENWAHDQDLRVDRNLVRFRFDGKEICVEYSEVEFFVDIMVKSSKSFATTSRFIEGLITIIAQFCASPQGCPGVTLVQAVIRPLCVQYLHLCNSRKDHSVRVSELKGWIEKHGDGFEYNWLRINNERLWSDRARDLLEGPQECSTSTSSRGDKGSSNAHDQLPKFYVSLKDVGIWDKLKATINVSQLKPFKVHLCCDGLGEKHEVEKQPGRDLKLNAKAGGFDFPILKPVIQVLAKKVVGASIDELINFFFDVGTLSNIDCETLHSLFESSETQTPAPDEVLTALAKYIECTGSLKKFLDVEDLGKFTEDFKLWRVIFADPPGRIGWLCMKHFKEALDQQKLKSTTIDEGTRMMGST